MVFRCAHIDLSRITRSASRLSKRVPQWVYAPHTCQLRASWNAIGWWAGMQYVVPLPKDRKSSFALTRCPAVSATSPWRPKQLAHKASNCMPTQKTKKWKQSLWLNLSRVIVASVCNLKLSQQQNVPTQCVLRSSCQKYVLHWPSRYLLPHVAYKLSSHGLWNSSNLFWNTTEGRCKPYHEYWNPGQRKPEPASFSMIYKKRLLLEIKAPMQLNFTRAIVPGGKSWRYDTKHRIWSIKSLPWLQKHQVLLRQVNVQLLVLAMNKSSAYYVSSKG